MSSKFATRRTVVWSVPRVPNYIFGEDAGDMGKRAVGEFTDDELRELAELWTADLLERAAQQRARERER